MRRFYVERLPAEVEAMEISALSGAGCEEVLSWLREHVPEAPFFYPPDQLSDAYEREIGAELIREAALPLLRKEVPHTLAVEIEAWKERDEGLDIRATLYVEQDSQKGIVIGRGGRMIKRIRQGAESLLAEWQERPVQVALFVKVARDWRNRAGFLRQLGLRE
jgi:GTP-binding protein Era